MTAPDPPNPYRHRSSAQAAAQPPVRVRLTELLGAAREAIIEHDGQDYRLRITSTGKLILTK